MTPRPVGVIGGSTVPAGTRPEVCWSGSITGTLIAPNMVLTCAHGNPGAGTKWTFDLPNGAKKTYSTKRVWINPGFQSGDKFALGHDIAVCMLTESVAGITPAMIYEAAPTPKMALDLCGYGHNTPTSGAGTKRTGRQTVDYVVPTHVMWMYDAGEPSTYASGDSGAPCFVAGTNQIVGIQSVSSVGSGGKVGVPGTYCSAVRVDGWARQWILSTVALAK